MKAEEAKRLADTTNYNFDQYLVELDQNPGVYLEKVFAKIAKQTSQGYYYLTFNFLIEIGISFANPISLENEHKFICRLLETLKKDFNYKISIDKFIPGAYTYQISWS